MLINWKGNFFYRLEDIDCYMVIYYIKATNSKGFEEFKQVSSFVDDLYGNNINIILDTGE